MPAWPTLYPMYLDFKTEIPLPWGKAYDYSNTVFKSVNSPYFTHTFDPRHSRHYKSDKYYN